MSWSTSRISKIEKQIENLDKSQKELDVELSNPEKFKELSQTEDFFEQYKKNQQKKQQLELEWEQIFEQLDQLK